jgi:hypothetical protein
LLPTFYGKTAANLTDSFTVLDFSTFRTIIMFLTIISPTKRDTGNEDIFSISWKPNTQNITPFQVEDN